MTHDRRDPTRRGWSSPSRASSDPSCGRPCSRSRPRRATRRTVLRIAAPPDVDVLAVLEALATEGLDVTSVRCVPHERSTDVRASG